MLIFSDFMRSKKRKHIEHSSDEQQNLKLQKTGKY